MNIKCCVCGKELILKPSRIKRVKHGVTCSKKCFYIRQKEFMIGFNNHQFGLKGELNSSFKNGVRVNSQGYILIYSPNNAGCNCDGYCREHRLVVEENHNLFSDKYFNVIDNSFILKDEFDVHHKNENRVDNDINNLEIISRSEHTTLHNLQKEIIRDLATGKIIGVFKPDELLENPEEGNQQRNYVNS